ncbi:MAG TPA: hypothetical protein VNO21_04385, partial [Polyangiaceae bacterium]|nr:hypothetical protein [Polyangiaceae bacterium]
ALTMARPSFILAQNERKFRIRHASIEDEHETSNIRRMVEHLSASVPGTDEAIGTFLGGVRERAEGILKLENDPDVIKRLARWWKDEVITGSRSETIRRALRQGDRTPFREALAEACNLETLPKILVGVGYKYRAAERICHWVSISALKAIALMALALHWRVMHGVESQTDAQLINDGSDSEFCIIALYGRGYRTEETKWIELHEDCLSVCEKLWGPA